jgi:hypothetical protein
MRRGLLAGEAPKWQRLLHRDIEQRDEESDFDADTNLDEPVGDVPPPRRHSLQR